MGFENNLVIFLDDVAVTMLNIKKIVFFRFPVPLHNISYNLNCT